MEKGNDSSFKISNEEKGYIKLQCTVGPVIIYIIQIVIVVKFFRETRKVGEVTNELRKLIVGCNVSALVYIIADIW